MAYLPFISDEDLIRHVRKVLGVVVDTQKDSEERLHRNTIDPFSALFDAIVQGITLDDWLVGEKARQNQKTLQNALGNFHQDVLGSVKGWENLGIGDASDIRHHAGKALAEIKNKFNTTKGNHRVTYYDDFKKTLKDPQYEGYTAYFVEVISKGGKKYDEPFTPSKKRKRRKKNQKIRRIDGRSFYALATGDPEALSKLYDVLPTVIDDILGKSSEKIRADASFRRLFDRYNE